MFTALTNPLEVNQNQEGGFGLVGWQASWVGKHWFQGWVVLCLWGWVCVGLFCATDRAEGKFELANAWAGGRSPPPQPKEKKKPKNPRNQTLPKTNAHEQQAKKTSTFHTAYRKKTSKCDYGRE